MSLSPDFLTYLANVGISAEEFKAFTLADRTSAFNNFCAFQKLVQLQARASAPAPASISFCEFHCLIYIVYVTYCVLVYFAFNKFYLMI